ncbi:hypothetical protein OCU04_000902 [Sclerotinia nivalis]|uniref:Uncharacterized protein n=1 Tax=Sclerotinia nivalis TaxID=352851 RepID=A0A9X0B031_9HELO|nr:hypothetical protein OCU04_000902 [Sclerotinia nivalis]
MGKKSSKKSSKKANLKMEKNESPSDRGGITEEFTIVSDAAIRHALSNLTLQPDVPVAGTSGHDTSQAESSQTSSTETANTIGVQGEKPTATQPCATEAKQKTSHSTQSQNKEKEKSEDPKAWQNWDQELLDALNAVRVQFEIKSGLENCIKDINEVVKEIIDEGGFAFNLEGKSAMGPFVEQIEKEFHLDQVRVLYREHKKASEKSIAEIHKRNQEVIWKFGKWRAERILEAIKFEEMGRMFMLSDTTGEGSGDAV